MDRPEGRDDRFERELRLAMGRVDAPESLETFLMVAAAAEEQRKRSGGVVARFGKVIAFPRPPVWFGGAIAALLVLGTFGTLEGVHVHREHERVQADQEFEQSQQITDRTMEHVREQLQRRGIALGDQ